ncbi:hypothetical protein TNCV_5042541 [Trichonephila clavipes]|nr:hypothetical protein TNCV_5042541 [Trichonephila clavipes]
MSDRGPRNSSRQRAICTFGIALSIIQFAVRFLSVPIPILREKTIKVPLPPSSRDDLWLDGYLEYNYAAKALYTYKHTEFEPKPYGTAVCFAKQYTGWG